MVSILRTIGAITALSLASAHSLGQEINTNLPTEKRPVEEGKENPELKNYKHVGGNIYLEEDSPLKIPSSAKKLDTKSITEGKNFTIRRIYTKTTYKKGLFQEVRFAGGSKIVENVWKEIPIRTTVEDRSIKNLPANTRNTHIFDTNTGDHFFIWNSKNIHVWNDRKTDPLVNYTLKDPVTFQIQK